MNVVDGREGIRTETSCILCNLSTIGIHQTHSTFEGETESDLPARRRKFREIVIIRGFDDGIEVGRQLNSQQWIQRHALT